MKKMSIYIIICILLITTALPISGKITIENEKNPEPEQSTYKSVNYNLVQQINPTRTFLPRIYLSGSLININTIATFDAYIINEGPEESSNYTLELKWSRISGSTPGVLLEKQIGEYGPIPSGYRRHEYLNFECWINTNIFLNLGFEIYEIQITNTADDLNLDDNVATFRYIVLGS